MNRFRHSNRTLVLLAILIALIGFYFGSHFGRSQEQYARGPIAWHHQREMAEMVSRMQKVRQAEVDSLNAEWRKRTIEADLAQYNPKTGAFEFRSKQVIAGEFNNNGSDLLFANSLPEK